MSQKYRKGAYHGKTEELCTARELWWWLKIAVFLDLCLLAHVTHKTLP